MIRTFAISWPLVRRVVVPVAFALISAGCAGTIETVSGRQLRVRSDEFRDYAEQVFRLQNAIATALALRIDAAEQTISSSIESLRQADDALFETCAALNEMATRRRDGRGRRVFSDVRTARALPECERAALDGRQVLEAGVTERGASPPL